MKAINGLAAWFVVTLYVVYSFTLNTAGAVFSPKIQASLHISSIETLAVIKIVFFFIGILFASSMLFYTIVSEILPAAVKGVALSIANTGGVFIQQLSNVHSLYLSNINHLFYFFMDSTCICNDFHIIALLY